MILNLLIVSSPISFMFLEYHCTFFISYKYLNIMFLFIVF